MLSVSGYIYRESCFLGVKKKEKGTFGRVISICVLCVMLYEKKLNA
jgi:hypothetical protein